MNVFSARFICAAGFLFWAVVLSYKFHYFGYYDLDLALYDQIVWNLAHGSAFSSLIGAHFLADHAHYIAFFIAPLYWFFPHPLTLIFLQLVSFFGGAYIFYAIARERLGEKAALALLLLYIGHPANIFMLLYEFHFETLGIGLIFLMFYYFLKDRWKPFMAAAVVLMLVKENMPLIVVMFGLWGLAVKKEGRISWGLVPLVSGAVFFLVTMFVVIPWVRQSLPMKSSIYWGLYKPLASHHWNPLHFILDSRHFFYLYQLFGAFLIFALGSIHVVLLASPLLLQNLLSVNVAQHTIFCHYSAMVVPFAAVASAATLATFKEKLPASIRRTCWALTLALYAHSAYLAWPPLEERLTALVDTSSPAKALLIESVPREAGVVATFAFLSHLTHHPDVYAFYNVFRDVNYFTGETPFKLPASVKYALIDYEDHFLRIDLRKKPALTREHIRRFLGPEWKVQQQYGSVFLYHRL